MSLSDIINISITPTTLGVTREGFGLMLILSPNATWSDRVRWYSTLAEISDDGFATDGPEYLAAEKVLSQPVHPPTIGIGRLANAPTQKYTITPTAVNSTKYTINVNGTDYSYTSDSSATAAEIVTGLSAALPVISGVTYGGSTTLTITQGSAGDWLQVAVADPSLLSLVMDATDAGGSSGVAADLDAILLADNTWYAVINLFNSAAIASAIAAWCESNDRLFICDSQDSPIVQVADGSDSTSIAAVVKSNSYRYTAVIYHANNGDFVAAAWAARCLPLNPGSETWAYKNLVGVTADTLTTTQRTNVLAKNASCYISLAGVSHTEFGQVGELDLQVHRHRAPHRLDARRDAGGHLHRPRQQRQGAVRRRRHRPREEPCARRPPARLPEQGAQEADPCRRVGAAGEGRVGRGQGRAHPEQRELHRAVERCHPQGHHRRVALLLSARIGKD